jgi:hypothetical protein
MARGRDMAEDPIVVVIVRGGDMGINDHSTVRSCGTWLMRENLLDHGYMRRISQSTLTPAALISGALLPFWVLLKLRPLGKILLRGLMRLLRQVPVRLRGRI